MSNQTKDILGSAIEHNKNEEYILKLFVISDTSYSIRAIKNINTFCEKYLKGRYNLEIIDINEHKDWADIENIFVTPLLIKKKPFPEERLIGDLSDTQKILSALDII
jgi:circadian clock protein KaiB